MDGTVPQSSNVEPPTPCALIASAEAVIRKLARRVGRGRPQGRIEDLYQTGMEYAARLAPEYHPGRGTTFASFVYLKTRTAMRQTLAREEREVAYGAPEDDDGGFGDGAAASPEELMIREEERRGTELVVRRALSRLDETDRRLVRAVLADGASVADAARAAGVGYDQARYRVGVAKAALRRRLGGP